MPPQLKSNLIIAMSLASSYFEDLDAVCAYVIPLQLGLQLNEYIIMYIIHALRFFDC